MANCLAGCSQCQGGPLRNALDTEVVAPFVIATFLVNDLEITVGNKSSPSLGNTASIKSFQYGASTGTETRIEIVDEDGGSFRTIADAILKKITEASSTFGRVYVEFGWILANCDGSSSKRISRPLGFLVINVECSFENGIAKYICTGTDMAQVVFNTRHNLVFGSTAHRMPLREALKQLFTKKGEEYEPFYKSIEFKKKDGSEWEFHEFGKDGPKSVWHCDKQNKISTAYRWLEPFRTKDNKGFAISADSEDPDKMIIWEDLKIDKKAQNIGTYIYNGGNCSNVLEFKPTISFVGPISSKGTGDLVAPNDAKIVKRKILEEQKKQGEQGGSQHQLITSQATADAYGKKNEGEETSKSQQANAKASFKIPGGIEAELRIQGDPSDHFTLIKDFAQKEISIVVINPFKRFGGECGEWLAKPICNSVLSNKKWKLDKVDHQISDGNYVTTLGVRLASPNLDIPDGSPFGGSDSCGYTPRN